jgi:hypothetical protein
MPKILLATLLALFAVIALGQDAKVPVSISHSGDDNIGKRLAFSLREAVRSSSGYKLVGSDEADFEVNLITLDPERSPQASGSWTVASASIVMANFHPYKEGNPQTWYPIYMTSVVMTVGGQRTEEQAKSILASLDEAIEKYRSAARRR